MARQRSNSNARPDANATMTDREGDGARRAQRPGRGEAERHEHRVAKVIELVGTSRKGFEDAVKVAIEGAAETTRGITGAQVTAWSVKCDDGEILEYKATVKVAFGVERT